MIGDLRGYDQVMSVVCDKVEWSEWLESGVGGDDGEN